MSTQLEQPLDVEPLAAPIAEPIRTRYGRTVRAPVRYEPIEQVEDDYATDDYDEEESEVGSGIEYSDSELEDDDDTDLDGFVVPDRDESDDDDNGSGSDSDSDSTGGVHPAVARTGTGAPGKIPTKAPVRGKNKV